MIKIPERKKELKEKNKRKENLTTDKKKCNLFVKKNL